MLIVPGICILAQVTHLDLWHSQPWSWPSQMHMPLPCWQTLTAISTEWHHPTMLILLDNGVLQGGKTVFVCGWSIYPHHYSSPHCRNWSRYFAMFQDTLLEKGHKNFSLFVLMVMIRAMTTTWHTRCGCSNIDLPYPHNLLCLVGCVKLLVGIPKVGSASVAELPHEPVDHLMKRQAHSSCQVTKIRVNALECLVQYVHNMHRGTSKSAWDLVTLVRDIQGNNQWLWVGF